MVDNPRVDAQDPSGQGWRPASRDPGSSDEQAQPVEARHSEVARPGDGRGGDGTIVGEVRGLSQRVEQTTRDRSEQVWSFRVEQHDERGNRLRPTPVELRGEQFRGLVADGDWVRVTGRWDKGTLLVDEVTNVTTGGALVARSWSAARLVVFGAIVVLMAALFTAAVIGFSGVRGDVERGIEQQQRQGEDVRERVDDLRQQIEEGTEF